MIDSYEESSYDVGGKIPIIPLDEESRNDILAIDRHTKELIRQKHRLYVQSDWECNTIANIVVESLIGILYSHIKQNGISVLLEEDGNMINFYELLELSASNKQNESAEKTGNINVKFRTGAKVDAIISDDIPEENKEIDYLAIDAAYSYPEDTARTHAMIKIDKIARKTLMDKYGIILQKDFMAIAICHIFLETLYAQLIRKLVTQNKQSTMINFNDLIEFHAIKKGDKAEIKLRPGMAAKLIIKSDETTEDED